MSTTDAEGGDSGESDGEQWRDDLPDDWDAVATDPPKIEREGAEVHATSTGSQMLVRQVGTQHFVACDREDIVDGEPDAAER